MLSTSGILTNSRFKENLNILEQQLLDEGSILPKVSITQGGAKTFLSVPYSDLIILREMSPPYRDSLLTQCEEFIKLEGKTSFHLIEVQTAMSNFLVRLAEIMDAKLGTDHFSIIKNSFESPSSNIDFGQELPKINLKLTAL